MSLKHLVRSLLVLLFLIGTCRVVRAQSCPGIAHTPSGTQVNGDTPISWVDCTDLQNHAVGMRAAGTGSVAYLIPITQVLADSGTSFPASTAATVVKAQQIAQAQARPTEDWAALWRAQKATEAIVDKNRAHLMKIPHVDDVSACGTPERESAICVQVENHKYLSEVERKIPSQIEGLPVRIEPRDQGWSL